jgi:hypothetical protein
MRPRLRLFIGDEQDGSTLEPQVTVRLGDITQALTDASEEDRTWLRDFINDEVRVSTDLYEVISSFSHLRPSA